MDCAIPFGRARLLVSIGMVATILASPLSIDAGGMDPNHHWAVNLGENWASVAEYKSYRGKTGDVFTRVKITGHFFGKRRRFGRDFQCGFETFWITMALILAAFLVSLLIIGSQQRRTATNEGD